MDSFVTRRALQARKRALAKTLLYRFVMVVITVGIAWLVVGETEAALQIGFASNLLKTGTYYVYERSWDHISWGVAEST